MAEAEERIKFNAWEAARKFGGDADDIAQEARLWLWKSVIPDYIEKKVEISLIGFCLPNLKREMAKAAWRSSRVIHIPDYAMRKPLAVFEASIDEADADGRTIADTLAAPDDETPREEIIREVRKAVEKLPAKLRRVAKEHLAGNTYERIGRKFGYSKQRAEQIMRLICESLESNAALRELAA